MSRRYRQQALNKRAQRDHWSDPVDAAPAIDANATDGEDAADEAEAAGLHDWGAHDHTPCHGWQEHRRGA